MTLTFHVRESPAARSFLQETGPVWLSGDCCAGLQCHMTIPHNGEYICSVDSQTDLRTEFKVNEKLITVTGVNPKVIY